MSEARTRYVQAREALLAHITETLERDERFVAAWLAGSYGRGEQTWSSDLDLHVVVANDYSELLCAQPWLVGAKTTQERLALFKQFGEPVIVYDAHANNTMGGTFTYVLLCDEMESLMPDVVDLGGYVPDSPRSVIAMRLLLLS